ncbi:hypothetical protein I316_03177 [Kwoniella heveanensis BCC8398]|uniref:Wax synthase domain-containing protein n=1 Tax=Kwoniella heveanensis BCC8398 TaxID=1296120 RepID=A0A1B9GVU0_9TREE|nr:hypothetical protein I316_03177 [Kwoniella heveanensis BCC8398]
MLDVTRIPLDPLFALLPKTHPQTEKDILLGLATIGFVQLLLATPYTPGWRLFRAAVGAPIACGLFGWVIVAAVDVYDINQWGVAILSASFIFKVFEYFLFFPPEEHCHRLVPRSSSRSTKSSGHSNGDTPTSKLKARSEDTTSVGVNETQEEEALVPEPVPAGFTWAKLCWAASLWFSYRGIGWNYVCPLPRSAYQPPYTRQSSRKAFLIKQLKMWVFGYLVDDFFRAYRNCSSAAPFFSGLPGIAPPYSSLTQYERAIYSIAVVVRVWFGLINSHIGWSMGMVILGGILGWETEMFAPWGWPPLFGGLVELWKHPGLSTMWSRTWQGYNRRWLYVLGWIGIGENILGFTHTGISSHPTIPPKAPSDLTSSTAVNTPHPSGHVSPSHPLPTTPPKLPTKRMSTKLMLQNLVKSFVVFTLSGLHHDVGSLACLIKNHPPGAPIYTHHLFRLTAFFVLQPVGLTIEALVKTLWRSWKAKAHPEWKKTPTPTSSSDSSPKSSNALSGGEPAWLIRTERILGFAWTWIWLGWTARWFVEGMAQLGNYRRGEGREEFWSLFGGLIYGKWYI